jgi:uncharacterized membrane protein YhaH (DUF805 family)
LIKELSMESASPYSPPQTDLISDQEEFAPVKILSAKGRIGRIRYIAYTIGISMLVYLAIMAMSAAAALVSGGSQEVAGVAILIVVVLGYGAMLVVNVLLTIQRCHDFNTSGWLSLVLLLPLIPLIFWFIPGSDGANRFGPPPPPNKGGWVAVVVILVLVGVIGMLAAIAIPAYQEYAAKAAGM